MKRKDIRPFFQVRYEINDTLEALANELLMTINAIETIIEIGGINDASKKILIERVTALKSICVPQL